MRVSSLRPATTRVEDRDEAAILEDGRAVGDLVAAVEDVVGRGLAVAAGPRDREALHAALEVMAAHAAGGEEVRRRGVAAAVVAIFRVRRVEVRRVECTGAVAGETRRGTERAVVDIGERSAQTTEAELLLRVTRFGEQVVRQHAGVVEDRAFVLTLRVEADRVDGQRSDLISCVRSSGFLMYEACKRVLRGDVAGELQFLTVIADDARHVDAADRELRRARVFLVANGREEPDAVLHDRAAEGRRIDFANGAGAERRCSIRKFRTVLAIASEALFERRFIAPFRLR